MILEGDGGIVTHLDGARITFDSEHAASLIFERSEKRKGINYYKFFRLDGKIDLEKAIELIGAFFPCDGMLNEYFGELPD